MNRNRLLGALFAFGVFLSPSAFADEQGADSPSDGKVAPVFDPGQFKCSDGYDPDTDASLHPPGQNPKVRMLINAEAQDKHEKALPDAGGKASVQRPAPASPAPPEPEKKETAVAVPAEKNVDRPDGREEGKKNSNEESSAEKSRQLADRKPQPSGPLSQAVVEIQCRNYQVSAELLQKLIVKEPGNAQAHYLLAVSYAGLRRRNDAAEQYGLVMQLAAGDPRLSQLAREGLKKVSPSSQEK